MTKFTFLAPSRTKNILLAAVSAVCLLGTVIFAAIQLGLFSPTPSGAQFAGVVQLTPEMLQKLAALPPEKIQEYAQRAQQGLTAGDLLGLLDREATETQVRGGSFAILTDSDYLHLRVETPRGYVVQEDIRAQAASAMDALSAPDALDEQIGGTISIFWQEPLYPHGTQIGIYRSPERGVIGIRVAAVPAGTLFYEDQGLKNDTWYYYTLTRITPQGTESTHSRETGVRPSDLLAPPQPRNILVRPQSDGTVDVRWDLVSTADLAYYEVYRSMQRGILGNRIAQVELPATSWHDERTVTGETYYYTVVAVDENGNTSPHDLVRTGNPNPFLETLTNLP